MRHFHVIGLSCHISQACAVIGGGDSAMEEAIVQKVVFYVSKMIEIYDDLCIKVDMVNMDNISIHSIY